MDPTLLILHSLFIIFSFVLRLDSDTDATREGEDWCSVLL